jgi:hypothetical protein
LKGINTEGQKETLKKNERKARETERKKENIKMTVFWDVAQCSLVETDRRFGGAYCLHHHSSS